ncbi:MAG: hypothetical protein AAF696_17315 [Bacteroidota bacterium]
MSIALDLAEEDRIQLWYFRQQDFSGFANYFLRKKLGVDENEANDVFRHVNSDWEHCIHCEYDQLDIEECICPKCQGFNYNWKIQPSFDMDFCSRLEYRLDFEHILEAQGFWCDGIDHYPSPVTELAKSQLVKNKCLQTQAWTGISGQEVYDTKIFFGPRAVDAYLKDERLDDCIPAKWNHKNLCLEKNNLLRIQLD